MKQRRPLALGAAVTIGFGSLFFASPAFAEDAPADNEQQAELAAAVTADEAPIELADAIEEAGLEVAALGVDANGAPVLVETAASAKNSSAAAEEARADFDTVLTVPQALEAYAATDVVGGAGYLADRNWFCSIGFSAWSPSGDPVLLTAGHCTDDGKAVETELVLPSVQPAVTGDPNIGGQLNGTGLLGLFGFSQFGGPDNAVAEFDEEGQPVNADDATDIAVIENIGEDFTLLPAVTDWTTALEDDLAASTIPVETATLADPVPGSPISKSGRTTGYTTGEAQGIMDGWALITDRWVRGFQSNVLAAPGDSGGSVFQGTNALGVISGGSAAEGENDQFTWTSSLKHALTHLPGYEIALDIDEPVVLNLSNGEIFTPALGQTINGFAPSNANTVTIDTGEETNEVDVIDGEWSYPAPAEPGDYEYVFTAWNGYSASESLTRSFTVEEAQVPPTPEPVDPEPVDPTPADPSKPATPSDAGTAAAAGAKGGSLAQTGDSSGMLVAGIVGSVVLVAGGAALITARRRRAAEL